MPRASYPLRVTGGLAVISVPGQILAGDADRLRIALLAAGCRAAIVVVDMSGTHSCDPAGLRVLQRAYLRARCGHGELRLVLPPGPLLRELAGAGLETGIPYYASLRAALTAAAPRTVTAPTSGRGSPLMARLASPVITPSRSPGPHYPAAPVPSSAPSSNTDKQCGGR